VGRQYIAVCWVGANGVSDGWIGIGSSTGMPREDLLCALRRELGELNEIASDTYAYQCDGEEYQLRLHDVSEDDNE
jgi:hypothetical protein